MTVHVKPERQDTIARAQRVLGSLQGLGEDIAADCRALDTLLETYHAAGDELSRARAAKRVEALLRSILDCLAAFANARGRS